jgi:competence protein ComEC
MDSLIRILTGIAHAQKAQGFLWAPVFMGLGIVAYFSLPTEPAPLSLAALSITSLGALLLGWWRPHLRLWTAFLLCFVAGFALAQLRTHSVYTPILAKKIEPVEVIGTVVLIENKDNGGMRLTLSDVEMERLEPSQTPRRVRITFRKPQDVAIGARIKTLAGLSPPSAPLIPAGFDFQRYMFFKGIGASGFSYGDAKFIETGAAGSFTSRIETLRHKLEAAIKDVLPPAQSAIATALMTGYRSNITDADNDAMRGSGLAHMLAISGLHIGLFSGVMFFCVRLFLSLFPKMALYHPIKKYAAVCAISAAVFYMLVAGSTIPTQRATLMSGIVFLAIILDRWPFSLRLVAFAALCVLILAPESLMSASFHMSFAAVAGLIAFYEWSAPYWRSFYGKAGLWRRVLVYVLGVCMTSVIATLATAPYALFHFQQLAAYSLLGNILAMPILSFVVMPAAVLSYVLMPLGLEGLSLKAVGWGVGLILDVAHYVAALDGALVHVKAWSVEVLILFSAAFVALILVKGRAKVIAGVPFIAALIVMVHTPAPFLLVSQGGAKLVAYNQGGGALSFSALNKEYFTRDIWIKALGGDITVKPAKWPREGTRDNIACGEDGCRIAHDGFIIDVLKSNAGLADSCAQADMIIMQDVAERACDQRRIVDKFDTYNHGAHALYVAEGALAVMRSEDFRGVRPWTLNYQRQQY